MISSIGACVLGASTLQFIWSVFRSYRSERSAFDLHYPYLMEQHRREAHIRAREHKTLRG